MSGLNKMKKTKYKILIKPSIPSFSKEMIEYILNPKSKQCKKKCKHEFRNYDDNGVLISSCCAKCDISIFKYIKQLEREIKKLKN